MKKLMMVMFFVMSGFVVLAGKAFAVPTIDGVISPSTEWDDVGYPRYFHTDSPNEAAIPDKWDFSGATLFQVYNGLPTPGPNDGVYLLLTTYAAPSLDKGCGIGCTNPIVTIEVDFNNDGFADMMFREYKDGLGVKHLDWTRPVGSFLGGFIDWNDATDGVGGEGVAAQYGTNGVMEFFLPSTFGGAPHILFPISFTGYVHFEGGTNDPDDTITGTFAIVPEPSSMLMLGMSLLGLAGFSKLRFWN